MSVVAVKITKDKIVFGADTQTTYGSNKILESYYGKIFDINGTYLGGVGSSFEIQFMRRFLEEKRLSKNFTEKDFNNLMIEFADYLKEKTKEDSKSIENNYILVHDKKAYLFHNWLIREVTEFEAIGSGGETARTAYQVFKETNIDPDLKQILSVTCKIDLYCHEPLQIFEISKSKN
jgi:ATP-dependent protease HslVU (ClpYQ) peptidase subunit